MHYWNVRYELKGSWLVRVQMSNKYQEIPAISRIQRQFWPHRVSNELLRLFHAKKKKQLRSITRLVLFLSTHRPGCRRLLNQRWPRGPELFAHVEVHWEWVFVSQFLVLLDCSKSFFDVIFALFTTLPPEKVEPLRDIRAGARQTEAAARHVQSVRADTDQ